MNPNLSKNGINILFAVNPIGLGHASRSVAVANELRKKGHTITFLTGYDLPTLFLIKHGYEVLKLLNPPNFSVDEHGVLRNTTLWMIKYIIAYKKAKRIIKNKIDMKKFDLIISDDEFASAKIAKCNDKPYVIITDIIESNFAKNYFSRAIEKRTNRWFHKFFNEAPLTIIPYSGESRDNLIYTGPFVRPIDISRETLRAKWDIEKKTILLTTGGSSFGEFLFKKVITAYKELLEEYKQEIDLIIVSSNQLKTEKRDDKAAIRMLGFTRDLHELIYASDLVITLAGKTTIDECMIYGTPVIAIPIKNHFEQERNARKIGYSYNDLFKIKELMRIKLFGKRPEPKKNNLRKVVSLINNIL